MKIKVLYGLYIALAGFALNMVLTALGMHSDPSKLSTAQAISTWLGLTINIVGIALGIRACRASVGPGESYPYGRALGAGALISLWNACFAVIGSILFFTVIDPNFREMLVQAKLDAMEAKGIHSERAEGILRMMTSIPVLVIFTFIGALIIGVLISLAVAAFFRREASRQTA